MKNLTILILFSFLSPIWAGSIGSEKITKMIEEIKEERIGIHIEKLETTVNPFILVKIKKEENLTKEEEPVKVEAVIVEKVYTLDSILNHAAFINKKWYKEGSKIDFYTVKNIEKDSVTLQSSQGKKILPLKKKTYIKLH
jgi:hypothetical protein